MGKMTIFITIPAGMESTTAKNKLLEVQNALAGISGLKIQAQYSEEVKN